MATDSSKCHICGRRLTEFKGVSLCLPCNDKYGDYYNYFQKASRDYQDSGDKMVVKCPGATIYDATNSRVIQGVKWHNPRDFNQGYTVIGRPVYAPNHRPTRVVKRDQANNICRCQACQDLTVRMRIYNRQKGEEKYQQNSPMMPRDPKNLQSPLDS